MTVCVFTKAKGESIYRNVKNISTIVEMKNSKPLYTISLHQENRTDKIAVKDIKGFEVYQSKLTWIEDRTDIVCPHCGQHYECDIINMAHGDNIMYFCPKCGESVDYDSYVHDTVEEVR